MLVRIIPRPIPVDGCEAVGNGRGGSGDSNTEVGVVGGEGNSMHGGQHRVRVSRMYTSDIDESVDTDFFRDLAEQRLVQARSLLQLGQVSKFRYPNHANRDCVRLDLSKLCSL
jgi:hypothetical protein